jgi:hypothetical protein
VTGRALAIEALNLGFAVALVIGLHVAVERPARTVVRRLLDPPAPPGRAGSTAVAVRPRPPADGTRRPALPEVPLGGAASWPPARTRLPLAGDVRPDRTPAPTR